MYLCTLGVFAREQIVCDWFWLCQKKCFSLSSQSSLRKIKENKLCSLRTWRLCEKKINFEVFYKCL